MENASKALLIAGAILLCILIIAIGMFIYNSAQSTITDSLTTLSTQEIEAFNNQFISYQGVQKGTNVKNLMGKLIVNANTFAHEPNKVPWFNFNNSATGLVTYLPNTAKDEMYYIDMCGKLIRKTKNNHEYYVYFTYQENGLIDCIYILTDIPKDLTTFKLARKKR